ncbi:MAG: hypothetical protein HYR76_10190 [Ignavibacteria bacterium]|nr:hypothetical protein [Ignavibacteria bacterium]
MKSLVNAIFSAVIIGVIFISGCELLTQGPPPNGGSASVGDLIINEVFTISPDRYYAYSWIELFNPTNTPIRVFDFTLPATAYAVGANGTFLRTDDDGKTWALVSSNTATTLNSVSFSYPDTGYAVGDGGSIFKIQGDSLHNYTFTDLTSRNPLPQYRLNRVVSPAQSPVVLAAGDHGTILKSINRGWAFTKLTSNTTKNLQGFFFVDAGRIYAVGDSGTIVTGRLSGSWTPQPPPPTQSGTNYTSVVFVSDTGWATGDNGAIAYTQNAGGSWKAESSGVSVTLRASFFSGEAGFNHNTGWVVGDNGTILKSTDQGKTWTSEESGTTSNLYSVTFVDSVRGWVFGEAGIIVATTNGGKTWKVQNSGTGNRLLGAHFLQLNTAVISYYQLTMWGQRRYFFFDPVTFTVNFDYITKVDTGIINYIDVFDNPQPTISPQGFFVIVSDSAKFKDHTNLGPGNNHVTNVSIGFDSVEIGNPKSMFGLISPSGPTLWTLLSSGEIRLEKKFIKILITTGKYLGFDSKVIDVARWGNFRPQLNYFPGEDLYPNNEPAGFIPEWYSLARYANDVGGPVEASNTKNSFYMSNTPIPGWYSQKRR